MQQKLGTSPILKRMTPGFQQIRNKTVHVASIPGMNPKGPVVVMLHGIAGSAASWLPLIKSMTFFAKKFLIMDLPCHGLSPEIQPPFTVMEAYQTVKACLVKNLDPLNNHMIIGNSLGGAFAFRFCSECPELAQSCVLISPAGAPFPTSAHDVIEPFCAKTIGDACKIIERIWFHPTPLSYTLAPVLLHTMAQPGYLSLMESIMDIDTHPDGETAKMLFAPDMLKAFPTRLLLIWGQRDAVLPHEMCEYYDKYLPDSVQRIFPEDMGHCPQLEVPNAVAKLIMDWFSA